MTNVVPLRPRPQPAPRSFDGPVVRHHGHTCTPARPCPVCAQADRDGPASPDARQRALTAARRHLTDAWRRQTFTSHDGHHQDDPAEDDPAEELFPDAR